MPIDFGTNLNTRKNDEIFGDANANGTVAASKVTAPSLQYNTGISDISDTGEGLDDFTFDTKINLEKPTVPAEELAAQQILISDEEMEYLGIKITNPTLTELLAAITNKVRSNIAGDDKVKASGGEVSALDSETLGCLLMMLGSKGTDEVIKTFQKTLSDKIRKRAAENNKYLEEVVKTNNKNIEAKKEALEAEAKAKLLGWLSGILSAFAAIASAVLTVLSFGVATPLAVAVCVIACTGAAASATSSALSIAAIYNPENEALGKASMALGICGAVLSIASGVTSWVGVAKGALTAATVNTTVRIAAICMQFSSGVTGGVSGIVNGAASLDLAETQKKLADMKIHLDKLDQEIQILTKFIEKLQQTIKDLVAEVLDREANAGEMLQQIMSTNLNIGDNLKC